MILLTLSNAILFIKQSLLLYSGKVNPQPLSSTSKLETGRNWELTFCSFGNKCYEPCQFSKLDPEPYVVRGVYPKEKLCIPVRKHSELSEWEPSSVFTSHSWNDDFLVCTRRERLKGRNTSSKYRVMGPR